MKMTMDTILSFLIEYISTKGCDSLFENSFEERINKCYNKALEKWTDNVEIRKAKEGQADLYFNRLKDYIARKSRALHPEEAELIKMWAEEILADHECSQFILQQQNTSIQNRLDQGLISVEELNANLKSYQDSVRSIKEMIEKLCNDNFVSAEVFWERWATGPDVCFRHSLLTSGREDEKAKVQEATKFPSLLYVEAVSVNEAMAFVVACLLEEGAYLSKRAIVATDEKTYWQAIEKCKDMIVVTPLSIDAPYAVKKGHTIIICTCPANVTNTDKIMALSKIDRDEFVSSLVQCEIDKERAYFLARESSRDISILRRLLNFTEGAPAWFDEDARNYLLPIAMLGEWNEDFEEDVKLVEKLSANSYKNIEIKLQALSLNSDAPVIKVGAIWKVKSPYDLLSRLLDFVPDSLIRTFDEAIDWIFLDDDPEAIAKMETEGVFWSRNNQMYSTCIRRGALQSLTILSILKSKTKDYKRWVDKKIRDILQDFTLQRYLTNRNEIMLLAEASPSSFLDFVMEDIKGGDHLLGSLMEIRHHGSIFGTSIYYAELLFALEALAWDEKYIYDATEVLMHLCAYPNRSNFGNRPINSLRRIYRFILPQTFASFETQTKVLRSMLKNHKNTVFEVCHAMLKGLQDKHWELSYHFRWRMAEKRHHIDSIQGIPEDDVIDVAEMMIAACSWTDTEIHSMLDASFDKNLKCCRGIVIDAITERSQQIKGNELITNSLRNNIQHHRQFKSASWALKEEEIAPYRSLLSLIESDDLLVKNKHYFAKHDITESDDEDEEDDYKTRAIQSNLIRKNVVEEICQERGVSALWTFAGMVKLIPCLAEAIVEYSGDAWKDLVYEEYCKGNISEEFVQQYYYYLFCKIGENDYIAWITGLSRQPSAFIGVLLYGPLYNKKLSCIAADVSVDLQRAYWKSVRIWGCAKEELGYVVKNLLIVERYSDVLQMVGQDDFQKEFTDDEKVDILMKIQNSGQYDILADQKYYVARILKSLPLPQDPQKRTAIIRLEFVLHEHLKSVLPSNSCHFDIILNREPELMVELMKLMFNPDKGFEQEAMFSEIQRQNRETLGKLAWNYFWHYHRVPCTDANGVTDYAALNTYIDELKRLATLHHRGNSLDMVIGKILGNFPMNEEYPSIPLCELIEKMNDDDIDNEVSCTISNRIGVTTRGCTEGGTIERALVKQYEEYANKARPHSRRLAKIFDDKVKHYKWLAEREDYEATLRDMCY